MTTRLSIGRMAIVSLVVVVIAVAGISSYYLLPTLSTSQAGSATSQSPDSACASASAINYTYFSPPPNKHVLLLQPGSAVEVCVTYQTAWVTAADFASYKNESFSSGTLGIPFRIENTVPIPSRCSTQIDGGVGLGNTTVTSSISYTTCMASGGKNFTSSFAAEVQPSRVTPTVNMGSFTIVYTITPKSNATGFYDSFGPAPGLLISVGYSASQVRASDFPYAGTLHPGGHPALYRAESVGIIGAPVENLSIPLSVP